MASSKRKKQSVSPPPASQKQKKEKPGYTPIVKSTIIPKPNLTAKSSMAPFVELEERSASPTRPNGWEPDHAGMFELASY